MRRQSNQRSVRRARVLGYFVLMNRPCRAAIALLAAVATAAAAPSIAATKPKDKDKPKPSAGEKSFTYTLPGDEVFPEGISLDEARKRFYVSSTTDGTIFRGSVRSRAAEVFLPGGADGRTTAVGVRVDDAGRLWIAGGATGSIFVYDIATRELIRRFDTGTGGFLNDIAITPNGDAYVTDSQRPVLHRVPVEALEDPAVGAETIPVPSYGTSGFGANGIVAVDDETLVYVQSNTGQLYRVDLPSRTVQAIDLGGADLTNGDGLALGGGRKLYVVRNRQEQIVEVRLRRDFESGRVVAEGTDPTFAFPTTAALAKGNRLLVVNSQFDRRGGGQAPELPFTVSSVKRP